MGFNYDTKSHVWLEPFSVIIHSMFPVEIVYSEWIQHQERMKAEDLNKFFSSKDKDIETGSRVEGFCIPELIVSNKEESIFCCDPNSIEWKPDKDTMAVKSHNFRTDAGAEILMFTVDHVESDTRYVKLRLTEQWKEQKPRFKDSTYLHQTYLLPMHRKKHNNFISGDQINRVHGPVHNIYVEGKGGDPTFDFDSTTVFTYPIAWPEHAMEWLVRPRINGWPSQELIEEIHDLSCHIAPVGRGSRFDKLLDLCSYMKSPKIGEERSNMEQGEMDGTEWRISFSVAEIKLSSSIPPVPRYVMVLLKMIKKLYLPEEICTYHLKNLLFWEVESRNKSFWSERNVLKCLLHLLDRLQDCLEQHTLPHYFIPKSNLLSTVSPARLVEVAKCVENVRINIVSNILSLFKRLQSLGFTIKEFIYSVNIEQYLERIQDGSQTQSEAEELYTSVLMHIIKQLNETVATKGRIYHMALERYADNNNMHHRTILALYVYQSTMSRMICEAWISTKGTNVNDEDGFLSLVRQETKDLVIIKEIPSVKDICLTYYQQLLGNEDVSEGVLKIVNLIREIYRMIVRQEKVTKLGYLSDLSDKNVVEKVTKQIKEIDNLEEVNIDLITNLIEECFNQDVNDNVLLS